jgi:hypothetical protein
LAKVNCSTAENALSPTSGHPRGRKNASSTRSFQAPSHQSLARARHNDSLNVSHAFWSPRTPLSRGVPMHS